MARPVNTTLSDTLSKPDTAQTTEKHSPKDLRENKQLHRLYIKRFQEGCRKAGSLLVEVNHPYIHKVATTHGKRHLADYHDLMQEGRLGALEGYSRFDLTQEVTPLTYVRWWVLSYVRDFLVEKGSVIQFPRSDFRIGRRRVMTFSELTDVQSDEDTTTFEERLVFDGPGSDEMLITEQMSEYLPEVVEVLKLYLTPREIKVLEGRFLSEDVATLKEVGATLDNVGRERVRQIALMVLQKLEKVVPTRKHELFEDWVIQVIKKLVKPAPV